VTVAGGRVTGVGAEVGGVRETFPASAGVVLASGGFEWNRPLWDGLVRVPSVEPLSSPTNRGDALRMAEKVGARLAFLDQVWCLVNAGGQPGQLVVNRAGRRFVNELADTDHNRLGDQVANADAACASTLRELAARIEVDADGLEATVEELDRHAAHGEDPAFHRGEIAWDRWRRVDRTLKNPALAPIGRGPYYAQRVVLRCFGTKDGPVIDDRARILDFDGAPIPGLCGAGNAIASPFGLAYPGGGGTLGPATTFGYVAGGTLTS
jgi:3-oxosteroid 1-dehydrogenase